jgi:acetyl-CoA carboxylase, biotin carboxylase subunit
MTFSSVLIANRGEIAVRIIRCCKELGIETVAVYSDADRLSPHVLLADKAYRIGPPPATDSYLNIEAIIEAAKRARVNAVHPGYGFLAENSMFAERVSAEGFIFIGPRAESIAMMGDKITARTLMEKAGVPIVPGTITPLQSVEEALTVAGDIGFPVLLKATGGGGGKGMRIVENADQLPSAYKSARSEAKNAFGNDSVYVEKYLMDPRHIEIQVLADSHGAVVHLNERECSIQRRHQKIIEEAPSAFLTDDLRQQMGDAAIRAARSCGYVNAGTIEFLVDASGAFYFLEMNTRVQVEHPVTELITGIDIVKEQIAIAEGNPLSFSQEAIRIRGHAIECRIYAEDPLNNFLPSIGTIRNIQSSLGPGIREDRGVQAGNRITVYYDPLITKIIAYGRTRQETISKMDRALSEYNIQGVITNIPACLAVLRHPLFKKGMYNTHFMQDYFSIGITATPDENEMLATAVAASFSVHDHIRKNETPGTQTGSRSGWKSKNIPK